MNHVSDFELDRRRHGELRAAEETSVTLHLSECADCAVRARALDEAEAVRLPTWRADLVAAPRSPRFRRWAPALAAGVLAVLAVPALLRHGQDSIRSKGGDGLELFVQHLDGKVEAVLPGGELLPGEAVRMRISSAQAGYFLVLGLDSAGVVTPYYPHGEMAAPVGVERGRLLDGSILLDETTGPERFFALFCPQPLAVRQAAEAAQVSLRAAHNLPTRVQTLPLPCRQQTFTSLKKERRPIR